MRETKKTHYEPEHNKIMCGVDKILIRFFTNDKDTVTCRTCKAAMKLGSD